MTTCQPPSDALPVLRDFLTETMALADDNILRVAHESIRNTAGIERLAREGHGAKRLFSRGMLMDSRLMGDVIEEMLEKRGLKFTPINWEPIPDSAPLTVV